MANSNELSAVFRARNELGPTFSEVGRGLSQLDAQFSNLGRAGAAGVTAVAVGLGAVTVAAVGATAALTATVRKAGELQQEVANLKSIKPEVDTSQVFSALNEMQTRIPQTASQLGGALYNVFSSIDTSAEQGLQLVEKFGRGAIAAVTDAQTLGTAVIGEMQAMGLGIESTDHVLDVFFNTVKSGVVSGQELAANLGLVSQSAKQAGLGVDELGAFIVGVTKAGGSAAQNINNLNNLLQKVTTTEAQKAMSDLGIKTVDSTGKFRPMLDVLVDLRARLERFTQAGQAAALQSIFPDAQARQAALVLLTQLGTVSDALVENQTEVGAAARAYETMVNTYTQQSVLLGNTLNSVFTSIGNAALPLFTAVTKEVQGMVAQTTPLFDSWQDRLNRAFDAGGFDAWLTELGEVSGELGREIEKWGPEFGKWIDPAKDRLGKALDEVWNGTIVPWLGQKKDELGTKIVDEWLPAFTKWIDDPVNQRMIGDKLGALSNVLDRWVTDTGVQKFQEQGSRLGAAIVSGIGKGLSGAAAETQRQIEQMIRQWTGGAIGGLTPGQDAPGTIRQWPRPGANAALGGGVGSAYQDPSGNWYSPSGMLLLSSTSPTVTGQSMGLNAALSNAQRFSPFDDVFRRHAGSLANDPRFISILAAATKAESGWDPNNTRGDNGHSWGLFQMHDQGAGRGMGAARLDPDAASRVMVPLFAAAYREGINRGLSGAELASYTARYAERPFDYENPRGAAAQNYIAAYNQVTGSAYTGDPYMRGNRPTNGPLGTGPEEFVDPNKKGEEAALRAIDGFMSALQANRANFEAAFGNMGGQAASALATALAENSEGSGSSLASAMEGLIGSMREAGVPGWRQTGDELAAAFHTALVDRTPEAKQAALDMIGQVVAAIKQANALTPDTFLAAFDEASLSQAMGTRGAAVMQALDVALEKGGAQNIKTLAQSVASMHDAFLADKDLNPEQAQQWASGLMQAVTAAVEDGSPQAIAALQDFLKEANFQVPVQRLQNQLNAQITEAMRIRDDTKQAATDAANQQIQSAIDSLADTRNLRDARENVANVQATELQNVLNLQREARSNWQRFREDQALEAKQKQELIDLDQRHAEQLAEFNRKNAAADMSGVYAATRHVDPNEARRLALKELLENQGKEKGALTVAQQRERDAQAERRKIAQEDFDFEYGLNKDLDGVKREQAKNLRTFNDELDDGALARQITAIKAREAEAKAIADKRYDDQITKIQTAFDKEFELHGRLRESAATIYDGALADSAQILQNLINANILQGGNPPNFQTGTQGTYPPKGPIYPEKPPIGEDPGGHQGAASDFLAAMGAQFSAAGEPLAAVAHALEALHTDLEPAANAWRAILPVVSDVPGKRPDVEQWGIDFSKVQKLELKPPPPTEPLPVYLVDPLKMLGNSGMNTGGSNGYQGTYGGWPGVGKYPTGAGSAAVAAQSAPAPIIIQGDVYGFDDFSQKVDQANRMNGRRGR